MPVGIKQLQDAHREKKALFRVTEAKQPFVTSKMDAIAWQDRIVEGFIKELDDDELTELRESLEDADLKDIMLGHRFPVIEALDITGYPTLLTAGIKQALYKGYSMPKTHFQALVTKEESSKKEEEYGGLYETDLPEDVNPGEDYPESSLGEKSAKIKNQKKGRIIALELELDWFDQQRRVLSKARGIGRGIRLKQEEDVFEAIMDRNNNIYRPGGVAGPLYTAGRKNLLTAMLLSTPNSELAIAEFSNFTDDKGNPILSIPDTCIVPTQMEGLANRIMKANTYSGVDGYQGDDYNWLKEAYGSGWYIAASPFVSRRYTDRWWLQSRMLQTLIYQEVKALNLKEESDESESMFKRDVKRFRAMAYYKIAPIDWRGHMAVQP